MAKKKRGAAKKSNPRKPTMAVKADRHVLYENSVQNVEAEIDFVDEQYQSLRGKKAISLREDFCGTGNTACEWVRRRKNNAALGVDLDAEVLDWGRCHHVEKLRPAQRRRVQLKQMDVRKSAATRHDITLAMNFSYWVFTDRGTMGDYFRNVHKGLYRDGVFFLDCFGGYDAFRVLKERRHYGRYEYIWDQAAYNPITGAYVCHIHFRFKDGSRLKRAFSYEWRLWTLPEIRELLSAAGFREIIVYHEGWDEDAEEGDGMFTPTDTLDPDAGWVCYLAAVK